VRFDGPECHRWTADLCFARLNCVYGLRSGDVPSVSAVDDACCNCSRVQMGIPMTKISGKWDNQRDNQRERDRKKQRAALLKLLQSTGAKPIRPDSPGMPVPSNTTCRHTLTRTARSLADDGNNQEQRQNVCIINLHSRKLLPIIWPCLETIVCTIPVSVARCNESVIEHAITPRNRIYVLVSANLAAYVDHRMPWLLN
jgi:hypothetical protein